MAGLHAAIGVLSLVLTAAAGAVGAWGWVRVVALPFFWPLLRAAQGVLLVQALLGGLLLILGRQASGDLHVLYGVLPLVVMFFAEQLRIASAEQVLDRRGLEDATSVGALPEAEQRSVVLSIVRREMGVMAAAAFVCVFLVLRAAGQAGGLPLP